MGLDITTVDNAVLQFVAEYAAHLPVTTLRRLSLQKEIAQPEWHSGSLGGHPAIEIAESLEHRRSTGRLTIVSDATSVDIYFDEGNICDARCPLSLQDAPEKYALRGLMYTGEYRFDGREKSNRDVLARTSTREWCMQASHDADMVKRFAAKLPAESRIVLAMHADVAPLLDDEFVKCAVNAGTIGNLQDLWGETDVQTIRKLGHYVLAKRVLYVPNALPGAFVL